MSETTILVVDNNPEFVETLSELLKSSGFQIFTANSPAEAQRHCHESNIDLMLIDIRLTNDQDEKDLSGLTLAKTTDANIPKIVLTAYPSYEAAREALGPQLDGLPPAVDFLAKREGPQALITAIHKVIMNKEGPQQEYSMPQLNMTGLSLSTKALSFDEANRVLIVEGQLVTLTPQEFLIIKYLFEHPNQAVSSEEMMHQGLGEQSGRLIEENRLNNLISRLRQKIEMDPSQPKYLLTVRGHGYKLVLS